MDHAHFAPVTREQQDQCQQSEGETEMITWIHDYPEVEYDLLLLFTRSTTTTDRMFSYLTHKHISITQKCNSSLLLRSYAADQNTRHRGVGVLAADSQSTSSSGYRASLWDPSPDFSLLFFLRLTITLVFFLRRPL
jgi:hypothetical protein